MKPNPYNEEMRREADERLVRIARLISAGVPKVEIARREGVTRARLYQLIDKAKERGIIKE